MSILKVLKSISNENNLKPGIREKKLIKFTFIQISLICHSLYKLYKTKKIHLYLYLYLLISSILTTDFISGLVHLYGDHSIIKNDNSFLDSQRKIHFH